MKQLLFLLFCCTPLCSFLSLSAQTVSTYVEFETNKGNFTVGLYDETPTHKALFLEHIKQGDYNNLIFHRVIKSFMVQAGGNVKGGNEDTKQKLSQKYTTQVEPEILYPTLFHKRGAVAFARTANEVNPEKRSNAFQFYVVVGQFYLDEELANIEKEMGIKMPDNVKESYKTIGGTPYLDNEYTVFGEVVSGFRSIEKIAEVETDGNDAPTKEIYIKKAKVIKQK